ncbi:hypothetical protein WA026_000669 [Henosepilachna vigintioctopunctata]|uniref:DNA repair protein SWI5 homolog n=1 Tax=Henosepilachna vigintioctopunctata TaxID=420089 RepID=A0AAW1V890_9CUCU
METASQTSKSQNTKKTRSSKPKGSRPSSQELGDKEIELKKELASLDLRIKQLKEEGVTVDVSEQMSALHEYNRVKDMTQNVLNYLSNATNESIVELHKKYDLPLD